MIIHVDAEADLFAVLSRLSGIHARLAGLAQPLTDAALTLSNNGTAVPSAFGNASE